MTELHPAVLMFIAQRYVENRVIDAVAQAGYDDLTLAQGRLMARVGEDGTRLTELAEAAQITKQSTGFLVDQLEAAGYASRQRDPHDARARLVCLGPRGREVQAVARRVEKEIAEEWRAHLGPAAYDHLVETLHRLREITDPYA